MRKYIIWFFCISLLIGCASTGIRRAKMKAIEPMSNNVLSELVTNTLVETNIVEIKEYPPHPPFQFKRGAELLMEKIKEPEIRSVIATNITNEKPITLFKVKYKPFITYYIMVITVLGIGFFFYQKTKKK